MGQMQSDLRHRDQAQQKGLKTPESA